MRVSATGRHRRRPSSAHFPGATEENLMSRYVLWLLMTALPCGGLAQFRTVSGSIEGSVVDVTGGAIAGVRVVVTHEDSRAKRTIQTDEAGQFSLTGLPPGRYTLRFEKQGLGPVSVEPFLLSVGQTVVERIEMRRAGMA